MDTGKVIVEKLSDNNYLIWSAQMEALLEARGVWRHISGETNLEGPQAGFTHGKNVARALIICSLTAQYVAVVVSEKDPKNMWELCSMDLVRNSISRNKFCKRTTPTRLIEWCHLLRCLKLI